MNQLSCSIIKDLIPSYLDNICSEESRKAVDEHLATCRSCQSYMENLKHMEIMIENTSKGELDFMKKVKRYYAGKNALGAALLYGLSVMILPVIDRLHPRQEIALYCILFTVLALGTYLLLSNYRTKPEKRWPGILSAAASAFGILYNAILTAVLYHCLQTDTGIFGMELNETGPVLNGQHILIVVIELLTFAACAVESVRKEYDLGLLPSLNLTCCILSMCLRELLFHMDKKETIFSAIWQNARLFLLITAGILLAEFALSRIRAHMDIKIGIHL